ncbi:MAG: DUF4350 domain-containing protein [Streptosporangiaceae bacterium]
MTAPAGTTPPATAPAPPATAAGTGGPAAWRRWRGLLAVVALCVLAGLVIALLVPPYRPNSYLDPASNGPLGARALADILTERGYQVIGADSVTTAVSDASGGPATLVITSPGLLTAGQRASLARARADLLLVGPGAAVLTALAPGTGLAPGKAPPGAPAPPGCDLTAARLAGPADLGGRGYQPPPGATACYRFGGQPALVRYRIAGRTITILGSGLPLTNYLLATDGNAALALNLLSQHHRIIWLVPQPSGRAAGPSGSAAAAPPLITRTAWLVVLQLAVAVLLAVIWRARRFGPLIAERLPVIVRAAETVEGHAGLYQARRARGQAAAALREAMLGRVAPALELPADAAPEAVVRSLAARARRGERQVTEIVYGPAPASDADLVRLARSLDELEREVRSQ